MWRASDNPATKSCVKVGRGLEWGVSPGKMCRSPGSTSKDALSRQSYGKGIQNEMPLHTQSVCSDVEKLEHSCTGGWELKWSGFQLWKVVQWFLKSVNMQLSHDPALPLLGVNSKELKAGTQVLGHQCSEQPSSKQPKGGDTK